ncbi:MAG: hypothetical protein ACODAD_10665 [Planctomycetota bacterium]
MKKILICLIVGATALILVEHKARAGDRRLIRGRRAIANRWGERFARTMPWHGEYYYHPQGAPTALVVPPVANMQTRHGWGVAQTEMVPIYHQFSRPYPGTSTGQGRAFRPTPRWPSHTDQFGVYYVRGPWR